MRLWRLTMAKSIIQTVKRCAVCHTTLDLHRHHIFAGSDRALSEKYGLTVWLCARHHNMSSEGVHNNIALDRKLKAIAQRRAMKHYGWSAEDWLKIFRRNYNGKL